MLNSKLDVEATGALACELGHIGTVEDVINATIPASLLAKYYNAEDYQFGFELASPKDKNSIGEAVLVNGNCYVTSTDEHAEDYYQTIAGNRFISGGMFLVPKQVLASHKITFPYTNDDELISLGSLHQELYNSVQQPLAYVALVHFKKFRATAISQPPLDGRNIFQHKDYYYSFPAIELVNCYAFLMGAMSDFNSVDLKSVNDQLTTVLYHNPFDANVELTTHTHMVTLTQEVSDYGHIVPSVVDKTLHLFTDGTEIISLHGEVYTISSVVNIE